MEKWRAINSVRLRRTEEKRKSMAGRPRQKRLGLVSVYRTSDACNKSLSRVTEQESDR